MFLQGVRRETRCPCGEYGEKWGDVDDIRTRYFEPARSARSRSFTAKPQATRRAAPTKRISTALRRSCSQIPPDLGGPANLRSTDRQTSTAAVRRLTVVDE
jgi:hypothetical protein